MDSKTLKSLDWFQIIEKLKKQTTSQITTKIIDDLKPSTEIEEVKLLQRQTSDALSIMMKKGNPPISGLREKVKDVIDKVNKGMTLGCGELLSVSGACRGARELKAYYYSDGIKLDTSLNDFFDLIKPLKRIEDEILRCIVDDESVSDNASPELKRIRREMTNANSRIKEHLNNIMHSTTYQKFLQDNIVTVRDGRYVIPVKQEHKNDVSGIVHYQSATGSTLFIEPITVVNENNNLRELKLKEIEEIQRILSVLTLYVSDSIEDIKLNLDMCVQLDLIFAKAKYSMEIDGVSPRINSDGKTKLIKARHPLIDKKKVVPIDMNLGYKFNCLIITGPNTGGKTVTLKTVGLFCLMVQSGLHIPASYESEISIYKKVFSDIGDEQSIAQSLSTFSAHMKNLIEILIKVDSDSLVLLDEVGSGTDPVEGSALAMAIIEFLKSKGSKVLATTHYSQLKNYAISTEGVENGSCEFDVETLSPTYKLLIGIPGKSNALAISKKLGLSQEVLETAEKFISEENIKFEDVIADLEYNKKIAEKERQNVLEMKNQIEELKNELKQKMDKVEIDREKVLDKAHEEARSILLEAEQTADNSLKDIRKIARVLEENKIAHDAENAKNEISEKLDKVQKKIISSIKGSNQKKYNKENRPLVVGDDVLIISMNQKGIILDLKPDGKALVQAGIMKITIDVNNLCHIDAVNNKSDRRNQQVTGFRTSKVKNIKERIDLRGMRVEEAMEEVDKYLDDACIANLKQITIVHGKGTGALRAAIHEQLRMHPHVKSFRIGEYGEGDSGITIVDIK